MRVHVSRCHTLHNAVLQIGRLFYVTFDRSLAKHHGSLSPVSFYSAVTTSSNASTVGIWRCRGSLIIGLPRMAAVCSPLVGMWRGWEEVGVNRSVGLLITSRELCERGTEWSAVGDGYTITESSFRFYN